MQVKRNLIRRAPTEEEKANLVFPKEKFTLISVDYVDEWDLPMGRIRTVAKGVKQYTVHKKAVHITVKCNKCGRIHAEATDRVDMRCKYGPCNFNWVDLTGKRFGKLVVDGLERRKNSTRQAHEAWYWRCICDCGNTTYRTTHSLEHSINAACHECSRATAVSKTTLPHGMAKWHRMMRVYKKNANMKGRVFTLSESDFIRVATSPCAYCGAAPADTTYGVVCNGIDRIDNNRGYELDNVAACCRWCNLMKCKYPRDAFLQHVADIARHCGLKLNDHPEREYTSSGVEMGAHQK